MNTGNIQNNNLKIFNIKSDLDYSISQDEAIDKRVLQVCLEAEKNYLENKKTIEEIKRIKNQDSKFIKIENQQKKFMSDAHAINDKNFNSLSLDFNYNNINNKNTNKNNNIKPYQSTSSINNYNNNYYPISNQSVNIKRENMLQNKDINSSQNINPNRSTSLNFKFKQNLPEVEEGGNFIRTSQNFFGKNLKISHKHMKSGKNCIACELKQKIENKDNIDHIDHVKFKINYDTNRVLLEAKGLMKKLLFKRAYEMLRLPISQGLYHADIFYLFGEVCRILKKLEESEKYLLECLKFDYHSPFVFYSLGLLYDELLEYKYSVKFYKHFIQIMETPDAHFQLSKSYIGLKKLLKAAIHITKAINLNNNVNEYYMFRANIYELMGFKELAMEDKEFANSIKGKTSSNRSFL